MSMTAAFVAISPEELEALLAEPEQVSELFFERLESQEQTQALDIDKSWNGIHFLLTGEPYGGEPPNSLPILGGVEIGPELGYGPARYLQPAQVAQASQLLASTPVEVLRSRYQPKALEEADIYPSGIWQEEGEQAFEYLAHWYELLRGFYAQASSRGAAMLLAVI